MKRILTLAAVVLALAAIVPTPAQTQSVFAGKLVRAIPASVTADDTDVLLVVRYIGSAASATVAVSAAGDLTFEAPSGTAVTEFECPVSAPLGGVIDVSDTACDTLGEVIDSINGSTNWRAYPVDGLRTDDVNSGGSGTLKTISATDAKAITGLQLKTETAVFLTHSRALGTMRTFDKLAPTKALVGSSNNPFKGTYSVLRPTLNVKSTYGSGTSTVNVYSRKPTADNWGAEQVTLLYTVAGGATTAYKTLGATEFGSDGIIAPNDEQLVVRLVNSAALATVLGQYNALLFRYYP
jgi:hypothetical protein